MNSKEGLPGWLKVIGPLIICISLVMAVANWFSGCSEKSVAHSRVNHFTYGKIMKIGNEKEIVVALPDSMHRGDVELYESPLSFTIRPDTEGTDGYVYFYRAKKRFHQTWENLDSNISYGLGPDYEHFYVYGKGRFRITTTNIQKR